MNKNKKKSKYVKPKTKTIKINVKLYRMDHPFANIDPFGFPGDSVYLACEPSEECCAANC